LSKTRRGKLIESEPTHLLTDKVFRKSALFFVRRLSRVVAIGEAKAFATSVVA
jgi:hypothetical protein